MKIEVKITANRVEQETLSGCLFWGLYMTLYNYVEFCKNLGSKAKFEQLPFLAYAEDEYRMLMTAEIGYKDEHQDN